MPVHNDPVPGTTYPVTFETIGSTGELECVAEGSVWQNFERLAGFIFEKNDFRVAVNTVKTHQKKRRQYDVIAIKGDRTVLAECKRWSGNRYRLSALKKAVVQHKERTAFYETITNGEAVPVIVTLIEEEIRIFEGVPLVPVLRLDAFLCELDTFADGTFLRTFEEEVPSPDGVETPYGEWFATGG